MSEETKNKEGVQPEAQHDELAECAQQRDEWKDRALRVTADFENYKKRMAKDQAHLYHTLQADVLRGVLEIVDNFDHALGQHDEKQIPAEVQSWIEGFVLIHKDVAKFLEKSGVKEITEISSFDPLLHEAIGQMPSDDHESGDIVKVVQKGYMLGDKVLRPAKVMVAQ